MKLQPSRSLQGGMEAIEEIKRRYPSSKVRIIAVTADAFEDTREQCLAAGFGGWLPKPFRVEDLVRIVGCGGPGLDPPTQ